MVNLQTVTLLIYQRTFLVLELLIECSSSPSLKWLFIYFSEIDLHPLHPSLSYSLPDIGFHSLTVEKYGSCRLSARWMEVALKTEIAEKRRYCYESHLTLKERHSKPINMLVLAVAVVEVGGDVVGLFAFVGLLV